MNIALILIVKGSDDEAPHLKRCLENMMPHIDHAFLNINVPEGVEVSKKVLSVVNNYDTKYLTYKVSVWTDSFAEARNDNLSMVTEDYDWIIWLDTDDTIDRPGKIRKVAEVSDHFDSIFVDYAYDHDEEMNPTTVHLVARMFKNNGSHAWKGRIHETLVESRGVSQGATKDFHVMHHAETERTEKSFLRNINLLEKQLEDENKDPDPRTFYYLGSTYMDAGNIDTALKLFKDYLTMSGWDQERAVALTKMGRIYIEKGDRTEAKHCFAKAVAEDPANPEPRVELGSLEVELKRYDKAVTWLEYVETMEKNMTTLERNPMSYTFRTYLLLADSYLNLGGSNLEKAVEYGNKALKYKRKDPDVKAWVKMLKNIAHDRELTKNILSVYKELKKNKEPKEKMLALLDSVPKQLDDNPVFVKLRDQESFKWPEKSIAIMTGDTMVEEWGPWSLKEGIGGSEEAVIRLAPKLSAMGYKVVVFGKVGPHAGIDQETGVQWRNFWECNLEDEFDIFIGWRNPALFDKPIQARKKYLWLHDVMEPGEFTPQRLDNITKVICLSKYHRSLFPMIPDDQILLSGNGIDPEDFKQAGKLREIKRDPHKIFYGSSHVRGLAYLYEVWPDVIKAVPDATLDVYYGRETYDSVHKGNPERLKWMDDMEAKAKKLSGVTDHGKISQNDIVRHMFSSGIWAYPCVTGDTLVDMPRNYSEYPLGIPIRKLVGKKDFPVWSYNESSGAFELKNVNWVALTRQKANLIKINWTDGTSLRCTPDHKIYTYKRGWVEAQNLQTNESVVALKKHMMVQVSAGQGKWPYEHRMIAETLFGEIPKGHHVHHKDGNPFNNSPDNLEVLSPAEHAKHTFTGSTWSKKTWDRRNATYKIWAKTEEGKAVLSAKGSKRSQGFWDGMTPAERESFVERRNIARYNHKVESIEDAGYEDVYDMNVEDNHNFIAGGVVVHNCPFPEIYCITAVKAQAAGCVPVSSNFAALDETVQFGVKLKMKERKEGGQVGKGDAPFLHKFRDELINMLKDTNLQESIRPKMMKWAKSQSWQKVADEWVTDFE